MSDIFDVFRFLEREGVSKVERGPGDGFTVTAPHGRRAVFSKQGLPGKRVWSPARHPIVLPGGTA
jgi:hypothetical protein